MNSDFVYIKNEVRDIIRKFRSLKDRITELQRLKYIVFVKGNNYCWDYSDGVRKQSTVGHWREKSDFYDPSPCDLGKWWTFQNAEYSLYIQISSYNGRFRNVKYPKGTYYVVVSDKKLNQRIRKLKLQKIF
jgi:hypothetical protein